MKKSKVVLVGTLIVTLITVAGMFLLTTGGPDPEKYLTIIRYGVSKAQ